MSFGEGGWAAIVERWKWRIRGLNMDWGGLLRWLGGMGGVGDGVGMIAWIRGSVDDAMIWNPKSVRLCKVRILVVTA